MRLSRRRLKLRVVLLFATALTPLGAGEFPRAGASNVADWSE